MSRYANNVVGSKGKVKLNQKEHKIMRQSMVAAELCKQLQKSVSLTEASSVVVEAGVTQPMTAHDAHWLLFNANMKIPEWCRDAYLDWLADRVLGIFAESPPSRSTIAKELGIGTAQLSKMLVDDRIRVRLQARVNEVTADPMIPHIREMIVTELLPKAYTSLQDEISSQAPWTVRQKARQDIMKLAGITPETPERNDAVEASKFLQSQNIIVTINGPTQYVQVQLPKEYQEAMTKLLPPDIIDVTPTIGESVEVVPEVVLEVPEDTPA